MSSNGELIDTVKALVKIFSFERYLFNCLTIISFLILIACVIFLFLQESVSILAIAGMCGSSGVITFTCGRVLKMWGDSLDLVKEHFNR